MATSACSEQVDSSPDTARDEKEEVKDGQQAVDVHGPSLPANLPLVGIPLA